MATAVVAVVAAQIVIIVMKTDLLNLQFSSLEKELMEYAEAHHVPIIQKDGLAFLETIIRLTKPKTILEIGTAIGYSSIRMHQICKSKITTLERNAEMVKLAKDNIYKAGYQEFIEVVQMDAVLDAEKLIGKNFDLIFIDAAKAQYIKFFELYAPLLNPNGVIVCDNISFHGLTDDAAAYEDQSRSVKGLIRKMNNFKEYFLALKEFNTTILPIGDGMAVAVKK